MVSGKSLRRHHGVSISYTLVIGCPVLYISCFAVVVDVHHHHQGYSLYAIYIYALGRVSLADGGTLRLPIGETIKRRIEALTVLECWAMVKHPQGSVPLYILARFFLFIYIHTHAYTNDMLVMST